MLAGFDKRTIQTFGIALIILGILLILVCLLSIIAFMESTYCPANGCPPYSLPARSLLLPTFFSGIALVIIGIILLIVARGMKPKRIGYRRYTLGWLSPTNEHVDTPAKDISGAYLVL